MNKIILCLLIVSAGLQAKEVDQFMSWGTPLKDSTKQINIFYNDLIEKFVQKNHKAGTGGSASCGWNIFKLSMTINGLYSKNTLGFFNDNESLSVYPTWDVSYDEIYKNSIFNGIEMFHPDLGRIIKVNGVRFGTDKVAHFFGMGFVYWLKYKMVYNKLKRKLGHEAAHDKAIKSAIDTGIKTEKGIIGWDSQKTASFADLEANYGGLKFFLDFCMGDNPMIKAVKAKRRKKWVINRKFDIKNYVNPWWDESFNANVYTPEALVSIKENILTYCEKRNSDAVVERFNYYRENFKPSYNENYITKRIQNGDLEDNYLHSIDFLCQERESQRDARKQK